MDLTLLRLFVCLFVCLLLDVVVSHHTKLDSAASHTTRKRFILQYLIVLVEEWFVTYLRFHTDRKLSAPFRNTMK